LSNVIKKAKRLYYDNQTTNSTNKIKTTWKIANLETHREVSNATIESFFNPLNAEFNTICHLLALLGAHRILHVSRIRVNIDGIIMNNQTLIAGTYKDRFLSVTDKINVKHNNTHAQEKYISNNDNNNVSESNSA
jgi:hypothetical protein